MQESFNTATVPKSGFRGGDHNINRKGRPVGKSQSKNKTNRQLRQDEFLTLVRKFKPHLTKAVQAAVAILDNEKSSESGKLRASALIIQTYKDLLKDLYDYRYDEEDGEEIQEKLPDYSLTMLSDDEY